MHLFIVRESNVFEGNNLALFIVSQIGFNSTGLDSLNLFIAKFESSKTML